jgi:protein gp37
VSKSAIEWTDETWNPIAGCTKVSAGCKHCYAEQMAKRLVAMGQEKYAGTVDESGRWTGKITFDEKALLAPLRWKKSRMVFVNSMSDLFHEGVPDEFIDRVFGVMSVTPEHTYQILTKRPARMAAYLSKPWPALAAGLRGMAYRIHDCAIEIAREVGISKINSWDSLPAFATGQPWPLPNVWLGTSVEHQEAADERIPHLLKCPAAVRFLSCEPLLEAVDLGNFMCDYWRHGLTLGNYLDWVICGGESGPGARSMHPDWARSIRDQCVAAKVPFFFKQWRGHNKKLAGRRLDDREWNQFPEIPQ